jgi:roadblock/LC7 domain-containing protein
MIIFGGITQRRSDDAKERKEPRSPSSPLSITGYSGSPKRFGTTARSSGASAPRIKLLPSEGIEPTNGLFSLATGMHMLAANRMSTRAHESRWRKIDTLAWQPLVCTGVAPPPLYMHSSCVVGNSFIVFGGCHKVGYRSPCADLYILDLGILHRHISAHLSYC